MGIFLFLCIISQINSSVINFHLQRNGQSYITEVCSTTRVKYDTISGDFWTYSVTAVACEFPLVGANNILWNIQIVKLFFKEF